MKNVFYRTVIFCSNPVEGGFRYKDVFQLFPLVSPHAPVDAGKKMKTFPVVLEYCIDMDQYPMPPMELVDELKGGEELLHRKTVSLNFSKRLLHLLSSITNYRFELPKAEAGWINDIPEKKPEPDEPQAPSRVGLVHFWYQQLSAENQITAFTPLPAAGIPPAKHPQCFLELDLDHKKAVTFSQNIKWGLDHYFMLDQAGRDKVDAAAYLLCNGIDQFDTMKSMSFVALVSSIETMVVYENRNVPVVKCEKCGQPVFKVMSKLRDYLYKYMTDDPKAKKKINAIYNRRSEISHAGLLLLGDHVIDWTDSVRSQEESELCVMALQAARLSLINFLLLSQQKPEQAAQQVDAGGEAGAQVPAPVNP